jgi:cellulose synthase/poly-beta-1,6-N-acetylglucosamine synthase-like glycosyltransferase
MYEQAPVSWKDLLNQRKRWYYGGLQLWRYWDEVKGSKNKQFIRSWVMALTLTYCIILLLPLVVFSPFVLLFYSKKTAQKLAPSVSAGFVAYILILQYAAIIALLNFIQGRGVEWQALKRVAD